MHRVAGVTMLVGLVVSFAAAPIACGGGSGGGPPGAGKNASARADGSKEAGAARKQPTVRTAAVPEDPCGWLPVTEVEAVVGKLAEPPKREDGCRYTIVMPEAVSARRQQAISQRERLNERLKATFKDYEPAEFNGPMAKYERDPRTYAITVSVDVSGSMAGELGMAAAGKVLASWLPPQSKANQDGEPQANKQTEPAGWDDAGGVPYGFRGRIGHVQISAQGLAPDVPRDLMQALAARVRDRIPDLPFPVSNPYQVLQLGELKDPCSLLTRAEAEAVLGPLVVEPYRSSSYYPPLVHGAGHACAYFTADHHVLVLSPTWSDGEQSFKLEKGVGGLIGMVAPQDNVVFKGPWDKAQISSGTGALLFLKGQRLLEVHYLTSSTDRRGAVKLAAQAVQRLSS